MCRSFRIILLNYTVQSFCYTCIFLSLNCCLLFCFFDRTGADVCMDGVRSSFYIGIIILVFGLIIIFDLIGNNIVVRVESYYFGFSFYLVISKMFLSVLSFEFLALLLLFVVTVSLRKKLVSYKFLLGGN